MSKYLGNKKNKQLFNGAIPRYENSLIESTKEHIVGYMLDANGNKIPKYNKEIILGKMAYGSTYDISSLNFDYINIKKAQYKHTYNNIKYVRQNGWFTNDNDKFMVFIRNNALGFHMGDVQSNSTDIEIRITLEYTKKVD